MLRIFRSILLYITCRKITTPLSLSDKRFNELLTEVQQVKISLIQLRTNIGKMTASQELKIAEALVSNMSNFVWNEAFNSRIWYVVEKSKVLAKLLLVKFAEAENYLDINHRAAPNVYLIEPICRYHPQLVKSMMKEKSLPDSFLKFLK